MTEGKPGDFPYSKTRQLLKKMDRIVLRCRRAVPGTRASWRAREPVGGRVSLCAEFNLFQGVFGAQ
jgi:hypothetical protein